jgi:hypothetical protein
MRAALINQQGRVEHVVIVGDGYVPPDGLTVFPSETANIGDVREGAAIARRSDPAATASDLVNYARGAVNEKIRKGFLTRVSAIPDHPVRVALNWVDRTRLTELAVMARSNAATSATWVDHDNGWEAVLTASDILALHTQAFAFIDLAHANMNTAFAEIRRGTAVTRGDVDKLLG